METRHPLYGQFGSELLAIFNHCGVPGVMATPGSLGGVDRLRKYTRKRRKEVVD